METELKNHSLIKRINRARIMNAIRMRGTVARSEIADIAGLDRKSVTNFIAELVEERFVAETGRRESAAGRPLTLLDFTGRTTAGLMISTGGVRAVLCDLRGRVLNRSEAVYGANPALADIARAATEAFEQLQPEPGNLLGIGVSLPGIMSENESRMIESVNLPALNGVSFHNLFASLEKRALCRYEEESRSIALAEKWFSQAVRSTGDFISLDVSGGVGGGIIHRRRLYKGAGEFAGEFGHIVVDREGPRCRCGNRGCLEALIAEPAILERLRRAGMPRFTSLREAAESDGVAAFRARLAPEVGRTLGVALGAIINVLSPRKVLLSGSVMDFFGCDLLEPLFDSARDHCLAGSSRLTGIELSDLPDAGAWGASTLILSELFEVPEYFYI